MSAAGLATKNNCAGESSGNLPDQSRTSDSKLFYYLPWYCRYSWILHLKLLVCRENRTIFFGTARPIIYINWSRSVNICVNWMLLELPRLGTSSLPAITNINVVVIWTHEVRTELDSIIVESLIFVRWNMCTDRRKQLSLVVNMMEMENCHLRNISL